MHFLDHQSKDKSPHPLPSRNAHREWQRVVQWDEEGGSYGFTGAQGRS